MKQARLESFIEATINVLSGWVIALLMWQYIVTPWWGLKTTIIDSLLVTGLFTVVFIIRSYFWRRFFNARLHRQVQLCVRKLI